MALFNGFTDLIGQTPTVALRALGEHYSALGRLYGKCEFLNPSGGLKDRPVKAMIEDAINDGRLSRGGAVICASTGGGGISAAMVCAAMGLRCIIAAREDAPSDTMQRLKAYGAEIATVRPGETEGLDARLRNLAESIPGSFVLEQFSDMGNPRAHRQTGAEILADLPEVDYIVAGIGTGGTVTGCGEYVKMHRPECKIIGVEPSDSPVISGGMAGSHPLTGIGAGFVPEILNDFILDSVVKVTVPDAYEACAALARLEGMLCGPSSGAALAAALYIASREEARGKNILVILPDRGERYLDCGIYNG